MTDWAKFEVEYRTLLETLKDIDPEDPNNKSSIEKFKDDYEKLLAKWGSVPVQIYNSGILIGDLELNNFEERKTFYDNWEKMQTAFLATLNDPPQQNINDEFELVERELKEGLFAGWKKKYKNVISAELSEPQKSAIFKVLSFFKESTRYEESYPFRTLIINPDYNQKGEGNCNNLCTLYASMLLSLTYNEDKKNFAIIPAGSENSHPLFENINFEIFTYHTRLSVNSTIIEPVAHELLTPEIENRKNESRYIGSLSHMVGIQLINEDVLLNKEESKKSNLETIYFELLKNKLSYILTPDHADNRTKKIVLSNLDISLEKYKNKLTETLVSPINLELKKFDLNKDDILTFLEVTSYFTQNNINYNGQEPDSFWHALENNLRPAYISPDAEFYLKENLLNGSRSIKLKQN